MAVTAERFGIYPATFNATDLVQIQRWSADGDPAFSEIIPGGLIDRSAVIMSHADPVARVATADLVTALGLVNISNGLCVTTGGGGATFRAQKRDCCGIFEALATANHFTISANEGFLVVDSINASQDDEGGAVLDMRFHALFDGTNQPLIEACSVNFAAAPTASFVSQFYMGPVYLGANQLCGVQSVSIDTGIEFETKRADGDVFARCGSIIRRAPRITITFNDLERACGGGTTGPDSLFATALGATLAIYFRKGVHGGDRVADAVASHVKVSATAGEWHASPVEAEGQSDGTVGITVMPTSTLAATVGTAIP